MRSPVGNGSLVGSPVAGIDEMDRTVVAAEQELGRPLEVGPNERLSGPAGPAPLRLLAQIDRDRAHLPFGVAPPHLGCGGECSPPEPRPGGVAPEHGDSLGGPPRGADALRRDRHRLGSRGWWWSPPSTPRPRPGTSWGMRCRQRHPRRRPAGARRQRRLPPREAPPSPAWPGGVPGSRCGGAEFAPNGRIGSAARSHWLLDRAVLANPDGCQDRWMVPPPAPITGCLGRPAPPGRGAAARVTETETGRRLLG